MIAQGLEIRDNNVFQNMYRENANLLFGYLVSCGFRPADADDISQEVWLKIWKNRNRFDGSDFVAWMFRIAKNCIVDLVRKSKTHHKHRKSLQALMMVRQELEGPVAEQMPDDELLNKTKACLTTTDSVYFEVLTAQLDGESVVDTATRLGISENTVYSRRNRGKRHLREMLQSDAA